MERADDELGGNACPAPACPALRVLAARHELRETGEVHHGDSTIAYTVTRSARRRKTVTITIEPGAGVRVAAPRRVPAAEIRALVVRRAGWILRRLGDGAAPMRPARQFLSGTSLPYLGRDVPIVVVPAAGRRVLIEFPQGQFVVCVPAALEGEERRLAVVRALERWYRARANDEIERRVQHWAPLVGAAPAAVLVRTQRQRWGSCSAKGVLRFNWRLVMAPPALIDYVVVHELAHLRVQSHAPAFWAEVARLLPDWKLLRRRLREIGPTLSF